MAMMATIQKTYAAALVHFLQLTVQKGNPSAIESRAQVLREKEG